MDLGMPVSLSCPSTCPDQGPPPPSRELTQLLGRQASLADLQTADDLPTDACDINLTGGAAGSTCPFPGARSCQLPSAAGPWSPSLNGMVAIPLHCHQMNARQGPLEKWIFHFNEHFGKLKKAWGGSELAMRKMLH